MVHVGLQLNLPKDLALHVCLLYLQLVHHLQRVDAPSLLVLRQIYVPESPAPQLLPQLELVYRQPLDLLGGFLLHADLLQQL